jgi:hypothetical protein
MVIEGSIIRGIPAMKQRVLSCIAVLLLLGGPGWSKNKQVGDLTYYYLPG